MKLKQLCTCAFCAVNLKTTTDKCIYQPKQKCNITASLEFVNSSGLLVIDSLYNLYILMRRYPYNIDNCSNKNEITSRNWRNDNQVCNYWEKFQIPRGRVKKNENFLNGALREFFEETSCIPLGPGILYDEPFLLKWYDCGKEWRYYIYIMFTSEVRFLKKDNVKIETIHNTTTSDTNTKQLVDVEENVDIYINNYVLCNGLNKSIRNERELFYNRSMDVFTYKKNMLKILYNNPHVESNYKSLINVVLSFVNNIKERNVCGYYKTYSIIK